MAFAPFSQNSVIALWSSGSGHAHDGQSNPSVWLSSSNALVPRIGPAVDMTCFRDDVTAGVPAAQVLGDFLVNGASSDCMLACNLDYLKRH